MVWRIHPGKYPPQISDEVKAQAMSVALAEALKQNVEFDDVDPDAIRRLGPKWQSHVEGLQKRLHMQNGANFDGLLALAWRVNRFAHYYEAALFRTTLDLSDKIPQELKEELSMPREIGKRFHCGTLLAQHYAAVVGTSDILAGTGITSFPETGILLEALALDCVLQAALRMPNDLGGALDLLADSASANNLALQGTQQLVNYLSTKAQRAAIGKAGAEKRHSKMAQLKEWTLVKHKGGSWKSANQAAHELTSQVLAHSKEIGANLTESNAQRTIAEWIRKSG